MNAYRNVLFAALAVFLLGSTQTRGSTIYFNDFQTSATAFQGLTASGTLSALSTVSLPTDAAGLLSSNQSIWLGRLGWSVPKSSTTPEIVTLALSGLVSGTQYNVAFDLFIGGSWDGSVSGYGPDEWKLTATSGTVQTLVDATFSNCDRCGAGGPPTYSDLTPLGGAGGTTFAPGTGADYFTDQNPDYSQDYGVYWFGHGSGNPVLTFTAGAPTATLTFARLPIASGDSADEYWALDNITVTGASSQASSVPEPGSLLLLGTGLLGAGRFVRRKVVR